MAHVMLSVWIHARGPGNLLTDAMMWLSEALRNYQRSATGPYSMNGFWAEVAEGSTQPMYVAKAILREMKRSEPDHKAGGVLETLLGLAMGINCSTPVLKMESRAEKKTIATSIAASFTMLCSSDITVNSNKYRAVLDTLFIFVM